MTVALNVGRNRAPLLSTILLLAAVIPPILAGETCPALSPEQETQLTDFVASRFGDSPGMKLQLDQHETIDEACYRRLSFKGTGPLGPIHLVLYATPGLRYITSDLMDTTVAPERTPESDALAAIGQVEEGSFASRGREDAPVTVVVFSDFQCRFCRDAARFLRDEPLLADTNTVRVVFRHLPLPGHDWSHAAAEAVACAQFQSPNAFWALHDAVFEAQGELSAGNLHAKIFELAEAVTDLDSREFTDCVDQHLGLGRVFSDTDLAARLGVKSTPTFFVNGVKHRGFRDGQALVRAVRDRLAGTGDAE